MNGRKQRVGRPVVPTIYHMRIGLVWIQDVKQAFGYATASLAARLSQNARQVEHVFHLLRLVRQVVDAVEQRVVQGFRTARLPLIPGFHQHVLNDDYAVGIFNCAVEPPLQVVGGRGLLLRHGLQQHTDEEYAGDT